MVTLRRKMLIIFSVIIILSTVLMVTFINITTRSGYERFSKEKDLEFSKLIASQLEEYYRENKSWDGVESLMHISFRNSHMLRRGRDRMNPMFPPLVITDSNGRILLNTRRGRDINIKSVEKKWLKKGIPITYKNEAVAFVFAGSMLGQKLTRDEVLFLSRIKIIVILVSIFILIVSIVVVYIFSGKLTKPIVSLNSSVKEIRDGNYLSRVEPLGDDELAQLGLSFNQMAESLSDAERWRKQIIADSAHELRTPVSLIQGNLEMILDGVYKADDLKIKSIYDETLVLSRLITELQELSSAESGQMILELELIEPRAFIETVLDIFRVKEKQNRIKIINYIKPDLPKIKADPRKLKQVLSNVLANALRHTPEGGEIGIRATTEGDSVVFKITDSGNGIKEDDLDRIFDRFYRIDNSRNRKHGGSGLGLAISREIIKLHGGNIYAESEIGKGTSITIILPIKQ